MAGIDSYLEDQSINPVSTWKTEPHFLLIVIVHSPRQHITSFFFGMASKQQGPSLLRRDMSLVMMVSILVVMGVMMIVVLNQILC